MASAPAFVNSSRVPKPYVTPIAEDAVGPRAEDVMLAVADHHRARGIDAGGFDDVPQQLALVAQRAIVPRTEDAVEVIAHRKRGQHDFGMIDEFRRREENPRARAADAMQHRIDAGILGGLAHTLGRIAAQVGMRGGLDEMSALGTEQLAEVLAQRRPDAPHQLLEGRNLGADLGQRMRHRGGNRYSRIGQRPVEVEQDAVESWHLAMRCGASIRGCRSR